MCQCCKTFLKSALMVKNIFKNCPNIEIRADGEKHWWKTLLTIQRDGLLLPSAQWETYFNFLEFLSILCFETRARISLLIVSCLQRRMRICPPNRESRLSQISREFLQSFACLWTSIIIFFSQEKFNGKSHFSRRGWKYH